jgi:hypothetical protein
LKLNQRRRNLFVMSKYHIACYLLLFALLSCRKPYDPPAITTNVNYLVVEGLINTGSDSTIIKLSRTVQIGAQTTANPELRASVTVLSSANTIYPLKETGNGYYRSPGLNLSSANTYALKIITSNGKTYQSDFLPVKNSPPIDSVYYTLADTAVSVWLSTHDPANKTIYYRWDFSETYIIHPFVESVDELLTNPIDTVVPRSAQDQVYTCWASDTSQNILLGSSAKLKQDIIAKMQLTAIGKSSEKIGDRYSILVKQYALTPDAYNYWQLLKTNTEQLGSIFDAQPSELPGNIHCVTTPSEPVIGYLSAGTASQLRIFIDNRNIPGTVTKIPVSVDGCEVDPYYFKDPGGFNDVPSWIYSGKQFVVGTIQLPGGPILGYTGTDRFCADCTVRGTKTPPAFWVY